MRASGPRKAAAWVAAAITMALLAAAAWMSWGAIQGGEPAAPPADDQAAGGDSEAAPRPLPQAPAGEHLSDSDRQALDAVLEDRGR